MREKNFLFKFKQFEIDQAGCAMKINTDGVLIAAMAKHPQPLSVLDVGTGTGVIALMLAQRFAGANIDAVEIDAPAAFRAKQNAANSLFSNRITVFNTAYQDFKTDQSYDLIVSNPPFFVNDLKSSEARKGLARHADADFFESFIHKSVQLLSETGRMYLILPPKLAVNVVELAIAAGLFWTDQIRIHSDEQKECFREIICLSRLDLGFKKEDFYIYAAFQEHTEAYKTLLQDFFLAF